MFKVVPLIGLAVAAAFVFHAATQFPNPLADTPTPLLSTAPAGGEATPVAPPPRKAAEQDGRRPYEPVHKALIRCLGDLDDLLDTVHDPASFEAVKPKLLSRVRRHAAQVAAHPNAGMGALSREEAQAMQTALNRHAQAMTRADGAAPGVTGFFAHDVAALLNPK